MMILTKLKEKIYTYIANLVISNKKNTINQKEILRKNFKTYSSIVLFTFSIGIIISAVLCYFISGFVITKKIEIPKSEQSVTNSIQAVPVSILEKNIVSRNIFNLTGEIPFEDTPAGSESFQEKYFENAPCVLSEKLPVEMIGIVYTGNPKTNLVILKDPRAEEADVYEEGQRLIDNDSYSLYRVPSPRKAQFRRENKKICVSLNLPEYDEQKSLSEKNESAEIALDSAFVKQQLGNGFATILNSARLVPQIIDGKATGFKIFAIAKDSLFDKIQLVNGDVIKNVNGISLSDPSQGFKIYEAFQDENNIILQIQRNNETLTKKVSVQ